MTRKLLATLALLTMLLVSTFGAAAAQEGTGTDPVETPETDPTLVITHPIVKLLGAYFGRDTGDTTDPVDPPVTDPALPVDPTLPVEPVVTPETVAAEIAAYHEDGMGFGVLVKLYAIAEESREACEAASADAAPAEGEAEVCTPLLVDDLVTEFKAGAGMGSMFKEYGKPALLGVGHVKKALKEHENAQEELQDGETTDDTLLQNGKHIKTNKGNKGKKDK